MNVNDARLMATWCAATWMTPSQPMSTAGDGAEHAALDHHLRADRRADREHSAEPRAGRTRRARAVGK